MDIIWDKLYHAARRAATPRKLSHLVEAGGVAAAVESASGAIYVGICVDTACTLGICAERSAIFHMITGGEHIIRRVVAVDAGGGVVPPCGACRELMAQLMPDHYRSIEVMLDYGAGWITTLGELTPDWWI